CHFLGYAHFCLGNHAEAISYYERALQLCSDFPGDSPSTLSGSSPETTISGVELNSRRLKNIQSKESRQDLSRAYCNLGLARAAVGDFQAALDCQRHFLAIAQVSRDIQGKFRALGNIGDIFIRMGNGQEAIKAYQKQLVLCREESGSTLKHLEASSFSALGACHQQMKAFDRALGFHTQELQIYKELGNLQGECRAHASLGTTHVSLGNHAEALRCFQAQLEKAKELRSSTLEVQALTNVGGMRLRLGHFDEALVVFERQAHLLESMEGSNILLERARTCGQLGECYLGLGDFKEAIERFLQFLRAALRLNSAKDKERAYKGVGNAYLSVSDHQQALMYFEKRLVVAHELNDPAIKCGAYGDLGRLHGEMGHFAQALSCLEHKMRLAQDSGDESSQAEAAASLGNVYAKMADFDRAIECHRLDLSISEQEVKDPRGQARAHGNLGNTYEAMGCFDKAIVHHEKQLELASKLKERAIKAVAYTSLGRIHHALGALAKATEYLQQGLTMAEQLGKQDEEASIRRRLAFALWAQGDLHGACQELEKTVDLLEASRYTSQSESDQKATYAALQRAQVLLSRHEAALATAERLRVRFERGSRYDRGAAHAFPCSQLTAELIVDAVDRQKAAVIYYSIAAGMLYSWCIIPQKGVVKFAETVIGETEASGLTIPDSEGRFPVNTQDDTIARHLASLREGLGVGMDSSGSTRSDDEGTESDSEGFGRLRRNHLLNSSSYSLSSVFSVGSVSVASTSTKMADNGNCNSIRPPRPHWAGPPALHALYDILIAPFMDQLVGVHEIAIVPDGKIHLVPFAMLRGEDSGYLGERFSLTNVPSIAALRSGQRAKMLRRQDNEETANSALVVGNPRLTPGMQKMLDLGDIPRAYEEAELVGELLTAKPMLGLEATKEAVMNQLTSATVIHIAAHVSWRLPGIVLSLGSNVLEGEHPYLAAENAEDEDEEDMPASGEFLLTPQDLMSLHLRAKLVVLSSCHTRSEHGEIREDGLNQISRAFLVAGAQCVITSLWPVADTAAKILYRTFYSSLLQGSKAAAALAEAMRTIQSTKQFAHPANWAGFVLIGSNVRVAYQVAAMGQALAEMLRYPDRSRDALRVCLHLVEKSLQRIHRGQRNAMYTTQKSIENKVGTAATGWKELLISVGFRFEPAANNLPAAVFFPQSDPGDRLNRCSLNLQALLGLSVQTQSAIAKLMSNGDFVDDIVHLMREVVSQLERSHRGQDDDVECPVSVKLWSVPGCHELLASLGFDLMEVGRDEVTLRMGKAASSRSIEFALQALLALLDPIDPQDETHSVQDQDASDHSDDDSLESHASLQAEPPAEFSQGPHAIAHRSHVISAGDGAFAHFVRTRGEPDGLSATAAGGEIEGIIVEKRPKSSKSMWSDKSTSQHIYASASSHSSASNQLDEEDGIRPRLEAFTITTSRNQQKPPRSAAALNDIYYETRNAMGLGLAPSLLNILRSDMRHAKVAHPQQPSRHEVPTPPARPEGGLVGICGPPDPPRVARPPPPPLPASGCSRTTDDRPRVLRSLQQNDTNKNTSGGSPPSADTEENMMQPEFLRTATNMKRRSAIFSATASSTKSKDSLI
ncbi:tetratricopeptide repeat protein 28-like, partial [Tropilaelaps mercedesae]